MTCSHRYPRVVAVHESARGTDRQFAAAHHSVCWLGVQQTMNGRRSNDAVDPIRVRQASWREDRRWKSFTA